jgi:hypothetical protein
MCRIFLSWYDGHDHPLANQLSTLLNDHGFIVEHSPYSPHSGYHDERWGDWYRVGLPRAMRETDVFVAVITPSCDGSTWMMIEYETACKSAEQTGGPVLCYVRFDEIGRLVRYPAYYLDR